MKQSQKVAAGVVVGVVTLAVIGALVYARPASAKPSLPKPQDPQNPPADPPVPADDLAKEADACATTLATKPTEDPGYGNRPPATNDLIWYTQVAYHKVYPNSVLNGLPPPEFPLERARYIRIQSCIAVGLGMPVPPVIEPPSIGTVERPGYTITPNCGGVSVWLMSQAMEYAQNLAKMMAAQYGTYQGALAKSEQEYYGGCAWQAIRDVAPLFWYRMRIAFFRGMVETGLITDSQAQTQINNMRAFPPQGIDPSMMTPTDLWGMVE